MARYYLIHQASYFDRLGGVISMMAAIFTVTWMQKNNEHLAMLAAGISTQRGSAGPLLFGYRELAVGGQPGDHDPQVRRRNPDVAR